MERGRSLLHLLSELGRRSILGAECPKDLSGCAVNHLQTLGQQAGISVVKLAVRECGLALKSKGFTDHESGGFGFLLVQGAGYKCPARDRVKHLVGYLAQQNRESLGGFHVGEQSNGAAVGCPLIGRNPFGILNGHALRLSKSSEFFEFLGHINRLARLRQFLASGLLNIEDIDASKTQELSFRLVRWFLRNLSGFLALGRLLAGVFVLSLALRLVAVLDSYCRGKNEDALFTGRTNLPNSFQLRTP